MYVPFLCIFVSVIFFCALVFLLFDGSLVLSSNMKRNVLLVVRKKIVCFDEGRLLALATGPFFFFRFFFFASCSSSSDFLLIAFLCEIFFSGLRAPRKTGNLLGEKSGVLTQSRARTQKGRGSGRPTTRNRRGADLSALAIPEPDTHIQSEGVFFQSGLPCSTKPDWGGGSRKPRR